MERRTGIYLRHALGLECQKGGYKMRSKNLGKRNRMSIALAVMAALPFAGCLEGEPSDESTGEARSSLTFIGNEFYDAGHQCSVGGASMHCCPPGSVMLGAHVDRNIFKCASVQLSGFPFLDVGTQRSSMHACPLGSVMIGLQADRNQLACQNPLSGIRNERFDSGLQDTNPNRPVNMLACLEGGWAMSGIQVDRNQELCAF